MPDYCADSRSEHVITSFKGSRQCSRVVAGLRCRLGSSYQKAPRSEPNFAKLIVSTPTKSTICDRLGYLDRARDLGTESCIPVHTKSLNSARRRTRRTRPRGGRRGPEPSQAPPSERHGCVSCAIIWVCQVHNMGVPCTWRSVCSVRGTPRRCATIWVCHGILLTDALVCKI